MNPRCFWHHFAQTALCNFTAVVVLNLQHGTFSTAHALTSHHVMAISTARNMGLGSVLLHVINHKNFTREAKFADLAETVI